MTVQAELIQFDAVATAIRSSRSSRSSYLIVLEEAGPTPSSSHEHLSLLAYPCIYIYLFGDER
jgi:hypothetical protein